MKDTLAKRKDPQQIEPLDSCELELVCGGYGNPVDDLTHEHDKNPYDQRKRKKGSKTP